MAVNPLIGATIVSIRFATEAELEALGFECNRRHGAPKVLVLSNGIVVVPSRDEEGNGPGALAYVAPGKEGEALDGYFVC